MSQLKIGIVPVTVFEQNCTLIWDDVDKRGAVIDPGGDVPRILDAIKQTGIKVEKILITHGHIDHVGGAMELKDALGVAIIGPHEADRELCENIESQATMFGLEGSVRNMVPDQWLVEGDTIEAAGITFEVFHCPGHAPGHVIFVNRANKFAHVGDVLFRGSIGRTDLPGGDHETLIRSIKEKVLPLGDEFQFICGHGPGSTFGQERETNPFLV